MNRRLPKISIVMPSLNQADYLESAIDSILRQDYPSLELIIVDGGSNDESVDIIKRYEGHLAYWVSESDTGQSEAINKGLERATGHLFNWINSDDMLVDGALQCVGEAYLEAPEAELFVGRHVCCDVNGVIQRVSVPPSKWGRFPGKWVVPFGQQSTFWSMERLTTLGGVRNDLHYIMDNDLFYRHFARHGKVCRVQALLGIWRHHKEAKQHYAKQDTLQERIRVFREYGISVKQCRHAWFYSRCMRLLDGSYWRSFQLTQRYQGRYCNEISSR